MSNMQIIFAGQKPTAPLTWVRAADGRVQQSGEADDLQDFAERFYSPAVPLTLVLPGEHVCLPHGYVTCQNAQAVAADGKISAGR